MSVDALYRCGWKSFMAKYVDGGFDYINPIPSDYFEDIYLLSTVIIGYSLSKLEGIGNKIKLMFIDDSTRD